MNDIAVVAQIVIVNVVLIAPIVVAVRMLKGNEESSVASLLSAPSDSAWPRGVQEEEPTPWRISGAAA